MTAGAGVGAKRPDARGSARRGAAGRRRGGRPRPPGPADGRHGDPGPRAGLDGPDEARRGRPRLRDRLARPRRRSTSCSSARATRRTGSTTRCSAASRPTSSTCRATGRSTSWSTRSRCATASSSPTACRCRRRRCRSPTCCSRSSRSSRSTARTCSTRSSCWPSTRSAQDDGAPDSTHGRGTINVPRILEITSNDWGWWRTVTGNLDKLAQFLETELRAEDLDVGAAGRSGSTRRRRSRALRDGDRRGARSRRAGSSGPGSATACPGTTSPRRVGHALVRIFFATDIHGSEVCWRKFLNAGHVPQGRRPDHGRRHDRQGHGPDRRQRHAAGRSRSRSSGTSSRPRTSCGRWRSGSATAATTRSA